MESQRITAADGGNGECERLADEFIEAYFDWEPTVAARLGLHDHDGRVPESSREALEARVRKAREFRRRLENVPEPREGTIGWLDRRLFERALDTIEFRIERLRFWETNPIFYSDTCDVSLYVKRPYAPVDQRGAASAAHLEGIPRLLDAARRNLAAELPRVRIQTALDIFRGHLQFIETDLPRELAGASPAVRSRLTAAIEKATGAIRGFNAFLQEQRLPRATDDYSIGAERLGDLLRIEEGVDIDLDRLRRLGEAELERNQEAFERAARDIDPARTPGQVLSELARRHPPAAELIPRARMLLEGLRRFIAERDLAGIPYDYPCLVEPTPPFARWAFAMMDAPGPFETAARQAFYYITLPPEDWNAQQVEEWLCQFEPYTLALVSIHEAWPGHFLHWLHFLDAPSKMTRIFDAYSFWEAWAHYSEEMMLDEGYGDGDPRLRLAQSVEALIRCVRYLVSIRMHAGDLTVEEAQRLFREDAHIEAQPGLKEAERGTFDPGYLNYTLGKLMLKKLRGDCSERERERFTLRSFHDRFLAYGAPPVPLVRRMMLPDGPREIL